jgi:hypothetical protein
MHKPFAVLNENMLAHRLKKSKPAFALLTISGLGLLLISAAILVAGCFLIYHDNFQDSSLLKEKIQIQFDYSHYWLGGSVSTYNICFKYISSYIF